jgi:protein-L-isoaspartate(D-aspartate) O-methyltransferase
MDDRSEKLRTFFARLVTANTRARNSSIERAFAHVGRETFAGPGPWSVSMLSGGSYVRTPDDDPAFLYQDVLVAIDAGRHLNIGLPSGHAAWLDAVDVKPGERVCQIGAGTGYYTAILAHLVGPGGHVDAYEIDPDLAARAGRNLADLAHVRVHPRSGFTGELPASDVIYVCVGATRPHRAWCDAMREGARLLFPMQPDQGPGGMLLVRQSASGRPWPAQFISRSRFISGEAPQGGDAGRRLTEAFTRNWSEVRSLRTGDVRAESCWFAGDGWWLSTAASDADPSA